MTPSTATCPQAGTIRNASRRSRAAAASESRKRLPIQRAINSAVVFARPDGSLAILESGPNDTLRVGTLDLLREIGCDQAQGFGLGKPLVRSLNRNFEQVRPKVEREAFVSLCGEQKSIERMQHMLMHNKPLRN